MNLTFAPASLIGRRLCATALFALAGLTVGLAAPQSLRAGGLSLDEANAIAASGNTAIAEAAADIQPDALMLRNPAISAQHVCFTYANKLWIAPRSGGTASPLASPAGVVAFPRFSPDGKTIAFIGNYDGNRDIYTMPIAGGVPTRVTHHPANESLSQWSSDNRLVFLASGLQGAGLARQSNLYTVSPDGGMPTKLPMPYAGFGALSGDGKKVAFTPHSTDTRTWKRYRGGMATDIWVMNLEDQSAVKITDWEGTDTIPMWGSGPAANVVFFLSDAGREHRLNIWSYDLNTKAAKQLTTFTDDDVRWPSAGPGPGANSSGEIIFQLGSKLMVFDIASTKSSELKITIPGARPALRPRYINASAYVSDGAISPSGKRVLIEARGDIWSVPAKEGIVRNLTATDNIFERDPSWSPDGKWIVYFSDESGEYELYIRPSDAKNPEDEKKDEKKDEAKDDKKDDKEEKKDDSKPADAQKKDEPKADAKVKFKPTKLTNLGPGFRSSPTWSGDSKFITFLDKTGALMLATLKIEGDTVSAELKTVDINPDGRGCSYSWSHDNAWIAYDRVDEGNGNDCIWVYNVKSGVKTKLTSGFFSCSSPAFDRKGEFLYYSSSRTFNGPVYDDRGATFSYINTQQILAAPLRADIKNPFDIKDDEEELKADKKDKKKDEAKPADKNGKGDKKDNDKPKDDAKGEVETSVWSGTAAGGNLPPEGFAYSMTMKLKKDGSVSAISVSAMGALTFKGNFDRATKALTLNGTVQGRAVTLTGTVDDSNASGTWSAGEISGTWKCTRQSVTTEADEPEKPADKKDDKKDEKKDDKPSDAKKDDKKELVIDTADFEARAIILPIIAGNFGQLVVNNDNKLIYARQTARGSNDASGIKIFDIHADTKEEGSVISGGGGFQLSGDGKKLLTRRGSAYFINDASAGGGKQQTVLTGPMRTLVDPRREWKQILVDAWRLNRDFFYDPKMHGVDWPKVRDHYLALVDDCSNREDLNFVISEMISELNIGHAYLQGPGEVEGAPTVGVGMLGADYVLDKTAEGTAYKISAIYQGGAHDADARGPLSRFSLKNKRVEVGDYILAVNGVPVDTTKDIYAAFVATADRATLLTVSKKPVMDDTARDVIVRPIDNETGLRYRAWIEAKRKFVEEKSGGKVGYIYVPNTGVDGQDELFRQFFGQKDKDALIIDERWNGGGQIPNRFIELLNRPVTNRWALRDGQEWTWPPDSHPGAKCMLINGLAGSGGDMFPWLFKHHKLGPLIGTRTWGGLVGISGNPQLIDGGSISVPRFAFYKLDSTWGVEGHGVDPDVVVLDDPSLMTKGQDPQLDVAINMMLKEVAANPYIPAKRPPSPDYRKGMGIPEKDR